MIVLGKLGMIDDEVERFVDYFWLVLYLELFIKLFI